MFSLVFVCQYFEYLLLICLHVTTRNLFVCTLFLPVSMSYVSVGATVFSVYTIFCVLCIYNEDCGRSSVAVFINDKLCSDM